MLDESQAILAVPDSIDLVNSDTWQPIGSLDSNISTSTTRLEQRADLLLLLQMAGSITLDTQGRLTIDKFISNNSQDNQAKVARLLGYLAEAMIVYECNTNISANRNWGNYARCFPQGGVFSDEFIKVDNLDDYVAVGLGLAYTKTHPVYRAKYHPFDNSRDICWVHKDDVYKELLMTGSSVEAGGALAGIQVKVSLGEDGLYVFKEILKKMYKVPVVYFDLGNDFVKVKERLLSFPEKERYSAFSNTEIPQVYSGSHIKCVGLNLLRGKDVSPELHDALLDSRAYLTEVLSGERSLENLAQIIPGVSTAFGVEYALSNLQKSRKVVTF